MEPFEETIDNMLAVAKTLGRLSVEGHITPDELAMLQAELMKPAPQPFNVFSSPNYTPPKPEIPSVWSGGGAVIFREDGSIGSAVGSGFGLTSTYLVLK